MSNIDGSAKLLLLTEGREKEKRPTKNPTFSIRIDLIVFLMRR